MSSDKEPRIWETGVGEEGSKPTKKASDVKGNTSLKTTVGLSDQIWMSTDKGNRPDPVKIRPVKGEMRRPTKPIGGMWTSTYTPESEYDSDWIRWCSTSGLYSSCHKWCMKAKSDIRVLVIDSLDNLKAVADLYEADTYKGLQDLSSIPNTVLDFPEMSKDFDAMRLTERWQNKNGMGNPNLRGWDTESTLHFRWNWTSCKYIGYSDL